MREKRKSKNGNLNELVSHLIPAMISIALFQVVAIVIYHSNPLSSSKVNFAVWSASQAIGGFLLGYISDKLSRKKVLVATQVCGAILLLFAVLYGVNHWVMLLFLGLTFSPIPVARSALIDNFPNESKVKMIGITFIALFIPWCFFNKIILIDLSLLMVSCLFALIANLILTGLFFEDKKDLRTHDSDQPMLSEGRQRMRAFYTALALLPGQIVFFVSDSFFEGSAQNASFFTALGVGVLIGAVISVFYRKIPHISILTVCYGIGFIFSFLTVVAVWIISIPDLNASMEIMLFSTLGGFYLPFVYDVILSATSSGYRGTICGLIEGITSLSAFIGLATILLFKPSEIVILMLMAFLFFLATVIQKRGEKNHR